MKHTAALGREIFVIEKHFRLYFKGALKEHGLVPTEAMVLLTLIDTGSGPDKTQEQIIEELQYDKAAMTRTMQSLERKGYVTRRNNPRDSRSYLFTATEQARRFMPELFEILRCWNDLLMKDIDDLDLLVRGVRKMAANAKNSTHGGRTHHD